MRRQLAVALALGAVAAVLSAEDVQVNISGDIQTLWAVAAPWTDRNDDGRLTVGNTAATAKVDAYCGHGSAYAEARASYDALEREVDFSLRELWIDYSDSFWGVRIGRQKAAWGKADGIDISNVLCPKDMSSAAAVFSDDSRLAVDALRLSFNSTSLTADAWWIPFFTPTKLPLDEENSLRKYVVPEQVDLSLPGGAVYSLPLAIGDFDEPEAALKNGEYGMKLSAYFSACDISLYAFYGWDDMPLLSYASTYTVQTAPMPSAINVTGSYKRMGMIAADAAVPLGETVLRLEAAFFPQRHFQKSAAAMEGASYSSSEKHEQLSALAGIDWMPLGWTITAQYYCDCIFGGTDKLERDYAYVHGATLSIAKSFFNDTLEASFSGVIGFNDFDCLLNPSVSYSLTDQIKISGGAYIFTRGPDKDGSYGAYRDLSSIYIKAVFSF